MLIVAYGKHQFFSPEIFLKSKVQLYIKIYVTYTSKSLILRLSDKFVQVSVCLYLLKAMYVRFLRRSMSVSVSSNVPRYLHFFQSFFCILLIVCCIVFLSFIVKFLSSKIGAIVFIALSMMSLLLLINPMSSA